MGGSADHRYNLSFIVQQAAEAGRPILGVSINYRLSAWGFLYGKEIQAEGSTMNGFRDQRLALHWVQENIAAFGGDPSKVTIWGESSGATSVGAQLLAYNGRDDKLFRGAIAESGAPIRLDPYPTISSWQPVYDNITKAAGCTTAADSLSCLRTLSTEKMNSIINSTVTNRAVYRPLIDGDFIQAPSAVQLAKGNFVKVPYMIGANTDEGTAFGPKQINTTDQYLAYLRSQFLDNETATVLSHLYPDIPEIGIPATIQGRPNATIGLQYKRSCATAGDITMHAGRRLAVQSWATQKVPAYSYRFNVLVNGVPFTIGSTHFQEVAFMMYNTMGLGYPQNLVPNPLGGAERPKYLKLAKLMTRMWIGFIHSGDPNDHPGGMH
jgi:carboxylesterase type B